VFFLLLCFLYFYCYYVFIDVRLSHLNKNYLLTYVNKAVANTKRLTADMAVVASGGHSEHLQ